MSEVKQATLYYLHLWQGGSQIDRKILSKIRHLNECGLRCQGRFVTDLPANDTTDVSFIPLVRKPPQKNDYWLHRNDYFETLLPYVKNNLEADSVVLHRFPATIDGSYYRFVMGIPQKIYAEHNTKEWDEALITLLANLKHGIWAFWSRWYFWYADRFRKPRILKKLAGGICVTREIEEYEKRYFPQYDAIVVSNGVDVDSIPQRSAPDYDGSELRILMVSGCVSDWLGLDLIITALKTFRSATKITLHCLGDFRDSDKRAAEDLEFHTVVFSPYLCGEDLAVVFNSCHIAMSTMALFRKKLKEASALKTREYMARGIPFVLGYEDTDLMDDRRWDPYYLQVPDPEQGIDFERIVRFAAGILGRKSHPQEMRSLAFEAIHMPVKMRRLKECLTESRR